MRNILQQIKWAYQRARYGYDETIKWSFADYFWQFIQPLKEFCEEELAIADAGLNPERDAIYRKTLVLIEEAERMDYSDGYKKDNAEKRLMKYFAENLDWYWN